MHIDESNTSTVILLQETDLPNPEDRAMLCALYSRSPKSVVEHVKKAQQSGTRFMDKVYAGFGHASVADLGTVHLFFEGVSLLAAVELEHFPLFNGQECSTRYIDFSSSSMSRYAPAFAGVETLFRLYNTVKTSMYDKLIHSEQAAHDRANGVAETTLIGACRARAFDYARGYLPAGCRTNVAMVTSLRKAGEHLTGLLESSTHKEVRDLAQTALDLLRKEYPGSFAKCHADKSSVFTSRVHPYNQLHADAIPALSSFSVCAELDFASWRDLHRHRSLTQGLSMPYQSACLGVSGRPTLGTFYTRMLSVEDRQSLDAVLSSIQFACSTGVIPPCDADYLTPIGTTVRFYVGGTLDKWEYIVKLRTGQAVHPTLRSYMQKITARLAINGYRFKADHEETALYFLPRASQTLFDKETGKPIE